MPGDPEITVTAPAEPGGVAVLAAASRAMMTDLRGDGEGVGLVVRMLGMDACARVHGGEDSRLLRLTVAARGTELGVRLHDRGEPVSGPPADVLPLLDLGVVTSATATSDGAGNVTEVRFALPSHHELLEYAGTEVVPEESEPSTAPVTFRSLVADDAPALTRAIFRSYGWTYPVTDAYYPQRVAAAIESGERIGEVAVTDDGEIVAHWGAFRLSANVMETGQTVTDPRFRKRGIAAELGRRIADRLGELGARGRVREPILTHTATQHIALREGATMVGAYISFKAPFAQVGITDGLTPTRGSLSVAYAPLLPLTPAEVFAPHPYDGFVSGVLAASDWPRTLGSIRRNPPMPDHSALSTSFDSTHHSGTIDITQVGADLVDVVDTALEQIQRSGGEHALLLLPANQPALAGLGSGLIELGFAYASYIPEFDQHGDRLGLQWLADPEVDTSAWQFADDATRVLLLGIAEQIRETGELSTRRRRRAAQRARLFAALD